MSSSQDTTNCYAVLGIPNASTEQVINTAYKKLVLLYHPDKTGGDEASVRRFHQIQEAVETLRDPQRRHDHDEALASTLYKINTTHRNLRRYSAADDRRNWFSEAPSWSSDNHIYNFDDPNDRYMFTYGTGVHMDPDSEASRAEKARHEHDIEEWEMRWMGIYPETERKKREFRKASMEARVKRDEDEMQHTEALHTESDLQTEEEKLADKYMESKEPLTKDKGACDDCFEEKYHAGYHAGYHDFGHVEPDTSVGSLTGTTNTPTQHFSSVGDSCLMDLSDPEHTDKVRNGVQFKENHHTVIDSNSPIDGPNAPACHHSYGAVTNGTDAELLQPFLQFFHMKLERHSTRYTADDMFVEMQGLILEIYSTWLEGVRLSFASDSHSFKPVGIDCDCLHLGPWNRTFGLPECHHCHLWMPIFVLTCPDCGLKACIRCKFLGN